jgi:D-3-phosphoglycerate dehydrogenase
MTKPFIVISDGFNEILFNQLKDHPELNIHPKPKLTQEELKVLLPEINGLVIRSATTVDDQLLEQSPNLKYVIRAGEGTDNINKKLCQQRDIKVSNTPGANSNSAAEHAVALMMTVLRKTAWAHSSMNSGNWEKSKFIGNELTNKTVGFVGFGRIGQIVAKRISGFDPKIVFYDPFIQEEKIGECEKVNNLEDIFKQSDIITVHTPLLPETKNIINISLLQLMKPSAILINAARGGIVNEEDLHTILSNKNIRGAGLDVFSTEPLEKDSPLRSLDNVVLTPHLGASTEEAQIRVGQMVINQLEELFLKNNLLNEVRI